MFCCLLYINTTGKRGEMVSAKPGGKTWWNMEAKYWFVDYMFETWGVYRTNDQQREQTGRLSKGKSVGWLWQDGKERGGSACVSTLVGTSGRAEISCDLQECAGYCFFSFASEQKRSKALENEQLPHSFHSFLITFLRCFLDIVSRRALCLQHFCSVLETDWVQL